MHQIRISMPYHMLLLLFVANLMNHHEFVSSPEQITNIKINLDVMHVFFLHSSRTGTIYCIVSITVAVTVPSEFLVDLSRIRLRLAFFGKYSRRKYELISIQYV